ncbi:MULTISPECIES: baseplate assembly protein [Stenotrophomonas]|uniref:Baseplate assembly protein n=1 Tax=Stenotrophomonas pavanii TaxID=487698 RepID=A0A246KVG1_9GAMM|nr:MULTISPECIES: baseplate J/gp47 family protein [Stenotrophomonas]MBC9080542.1 baseplate assembly protein [Stenotrophomonas maltophilia]MBC9092639.1 baseplate assembly protein [Stenotrophomonas maltophilia]MBH1388070.1 baseplate J/gp47 family protein [Stenotrophomonas maltophilia]MBH1521680.1 baseplate J/gp47 family protein [Stenotrophomonas maltophilia]MBN4940611.1 baseplate J/gp47 family protein [Stenotrophomonas maltophilia]
MASGSFTSVNLSQLPAPAVIEVLDFEAMFDESLTALQALDPTFDALLPSDPAFKILEVCTYLRLLDRQRVNDAARGVMLAYAGGSDLDHLAAIFGVVRQVLDPGKPQEGIPPRYESDEDFRRRIQLGPEGFSVAGPEGAYVFHALSADPRALDASATSPDPGEVVVSVLSREADGTASQGLLDIVEAKLSADDVRPLTDHVSVKSATIINYTVDATLFTFAGPDSQVVLAEARTRLDRYISESHRLGRDVTRSGLFAALHAEGVQRVEISSPATDIVVDRTQATYCTHITLMHGGNDE